MILLSLLRWREDTDWNDVNIERTKTALIPVIAAIDKVYCQHGRFPESLDLLVPEYIPVIPVPCGKGVLFLGHFRNQRNYYELVFERGEASELMLYRSRDQSWHHYR